MRNAVIAISCLTAFVQTASGQLTLTPSLGIENARTTVGVNNNPFIRPLSLQLRPQAAIRLQYAAKSGHGIFAGIATSTTGVDFSFTDPEASFSRFNASRSDVQLRLEGGYLFNTKPIRLGNGSAAKKPTSQGRGHCGQMKMSSCGQSKTGAVKQTQTITIRTACGQKTYTVRMRQPVKQPVVSLRMQPQIGMAFIPSPAATFSSKMTGSQTQYSYMAGNWNTALIGGMGFEFARGNNKFLQVNMQYLKGMGNLDNEMLATNTGSKSTETHFASRTSAWRLSFGIPFTLSKKQARDNQRIVIVQKQEKKTEVKKNCGQQKSYRCLFGN